MSGDFVCGCLWGVISVSVVFALIVWGLMWWVA